MGGKRPSSSPAVGAKRPKHSHDGGHAPHKAVPAKPTGPSKPQTSKERKEALRERKAKVKRNFDLIQEVTAMWEEMRRHDVTPERRSALATAVLSKTRGRLAELAASHTASRIVQACVKHGSDKERAVILEELKPKLQELAKSPYGRFVVSKLISTAPKAQLREYQKALKGRIPELVRHPAATHVVDELYSLSDSKARNAMASEFYGREYRLFEGGTLNGLAGAPASLERLLVGVDAAKAGAILGHMAAAVLPIVEKKLVDCALVQRVLAEFLAQAPASLVADALAPLAGEALLHMVHTREGAAAACAVFAYGSPRDRKRAVRALKGHVGSMARHEHGHLPLITCLSVVDDTALLRKFVVGELQKDLLDLIQHPWGRRVVLQLLSPDCNRYLPPAAQALVHPPTKIYTPPGSAPGGCGPDCTEHEEEQHVAATGPAPKAGKEGKDKKKQKKKSEGSDDEDAAPAPLAAGPLGLSKKDGATRRSEVLGGGLGAALCALCASEAGLLLRSATAADVLAEVAAGGGVLERGAGGPAAVDAVHAAVVALAAEPREGAGEGGASAPAQEHVLVSWHGSRALRRLVLAAGEEGPGGDAPRRFLAALWRGALRGRCAEWAPTHAAKVLAAAWAGATPEDKSEIQAELAAAVEGGDVEAWAAKFLARGKA